MEETTTERYYGQEYAEGTTEQPKSVYDRLRDYYDDGDFVSVMNVDTAPIRYQFATPLGYETFSAYPGHKDTRQPNPPQVVTLQPGQMKLCPAYEADLMIVNLIKQMASKVTAKKIADGQYKEWQSTNWSDPTLQKALIERIFKGKQNLVGEANAGIAQIQAPEGQMNHVAPTESVPTTEIMAELGLQEDANESRQSKKNKA